MQPHYHKTLSTWHTPLCGIFPSTAFTDHCLPDSARARVQTASTRLQRHWQSDSTQTLEWRGRAPSVPLPVRMWHQPQVPWLGNPVTLFALGGTEEEGNQNGTRQPTERHPSEFFPVISTWSNPIRFGNWSRDILSRLWSYMHLWLLETDVWLVIHSIKKSCVKTLKKYDVKVLFI